MMVEGEGVEMEVCEEENVLSVGGRIMYRL